MLKNIYCARRYIDLSVSTAERVQDNPWKSKVRDGSQEGEGGRVVSREALLSLYCVALYRSLCKLIPMAD